MKAKPLFQKDNAWLFTSVTALLAAGGVKAFLWAFPAWRVVPYFLSMALLAICAALLTLTMKNNRDAAHPLRDALIAGGVFLAVAFGAVFLVNNVILHANRSTLAAGIMAVAFAAVFLVWCVLTLLSCRGKAGLKICAALLCAVFLANGAFPGIKGLLPVRYDHPFTDKITETKGRDNVGKDNKLIVNADDSHWWGFWNLLAENGTFDDESLNEYVMNYADSGVTDLLFNIFCQSSDTPSEVMTFRGDRYEQTEQHGNPVDYSNYYGLNAFYNEQKIDIFAKWIEKCKEVNIRPWLTLRMNDCHDPGEAASQLRGDLFYTAEENGWTVGDEYGYFRHCFNYAVPEIRQLMLDYTREQLLRYDVYGLELDFMREIYCFDCKNADTNEIVGIMNDYIRDTAAIVKEAEEKWGHEIKLSARLMRDLDQCYTYGFDPQTWCEEGLVDAICVTPRFSSNDSAIPIADWKERCKGAEIWAGVETLVNTNAKGCCASPEVARGYGAQYLTAGADGLYLFNYMTSPPGVGEREKEVYDTCGSLDEILKHPRRHVVTYQDTCPDGWEPYDPLPLKVKAGGTASLVVETGYIPDGAAVTVYLGLNKELTDEAALTVSVNGTALTNAGRSEVYGRSEADGSDVAQGYCREDCVIYAFTLDAAGLPNLLTLTLANAGRGTVCVTYAEIDVQP
ncbi:MAG: hypothetical protein IJK89_11585 [Clostridia bacterium]|nr:hypothetical protein [Clostridia bacterium]